MKFRYLGWIVAGALIVVAATAGFQTTTTKIGVVDITKVFNDSDYAKTQMETLKQFGTARQEMIQFVDQYRVFTPEQATTFHDLSLKSVISAAEKAQLDGIKTAVKTSDARLKDLQQKSNPTPAESTEMADLSRRVQTTTDTAQRWSRDAQDEYEGKRQELQKAGLDKVRESIKAVAKEKEYTIVFISDIAPYGVNDITPLALAAMNKK
jgi:Skp family chaperone for outer membrane proteins